MQQLDDEILQKIAKEMNLSETAFVLEKNDQGTYDKGQNISASVFFLHPFISEIKIQILHTCCSFFSTSLQLEA